MDGAAVLSWLEQVVDALSRDPQTATEALLGFRKESHAIDAAKYVLTRGVSASDGAKHQAVQALQSATLYRWNDLPYAARLELVQFSWDRALAATIALDTPPSQRAHHPDAMPHVVRSSLIQTCAVLWKRGWPATPEEGGWARDIRSRLFDSLRECAGSGTDNQVLAVAELLTALTIEFGTSKATSAMGVTVEFHRAAHSAFENDGGIEQCLRIGMDLLGGAVARVNTARVPAGVNSGVSRISFNFGSALDGLRALRELRGATALCIEVLSWQHGVLDVFNVPAAGEQALLKLPEPWRPYVVRPDFLGAIFDAYDAARNLPNHVRAQMAHEQQQQCQPAVLPDAAHDLRQLLILLGSVTGRIFSSAVGGDDEKAAYASFMARGTVRLLEQPLSAASSIDDAEAAQAETKDVCTLLHRIVATFGLKYLARSGAVEFSGMLASLAAATDRLLSAAVAAAESPDHDELDEPWQARGAQKLLDAWSSLCLTAAAFLDESWVAGVETALAATTANNSQRAPPPPRRVVKQPSWEREPLLVSAARAVQELANPLYERFLRCRVAIARADALRGSSAAAAANTANDAEADGIGLLEEAAETNELKDALESAAAVGRLVLPAALPLIRSLLVGGNGESSDILSRLRAMTAAAAAGTATGGEGEALLEELQLLVLSAGYLLADEGDGEVPAIPSQVLRACGGGSNAIDAVVSACPASTESNHGSPSALAAAVAENGTIAAAAATPTAAQALAGAIVANATGDAAAQSAVLGLVAGVLQVLEAEVEWVSQRPFDEMRSPLVAETLLWFAARWAKTYLQPDPAVHYPPEALQLCSHLLTAYSDDGNATETNSNAARCAELLVRSVVAYGTLWPHEKGVMEEGCRLLSVLAGPRHHALAGGSGGGNDNGDGLGPTGGMSVAVRLDCFGQLLAQHGETLSCRVTHQQPQQGSVAHFPGRLSLDLRERVMTVLTAGSQSSKRLSDSAPRLECLMLPVEQRLTQLVSMAEQELSKRLMEQAQQHQQRQQHQQQQQGLHQTRGGGSNGGVLSVELVEAIFVVVHIYSGAALSVTAQSCAAVASRLGPALGPLARLMELAVTPSDAIQQQQQQQQQQHSRLGRFVADPTMAAPFLHFATCFAEAILPFLDNSGTSAFFAFSQKIFAIYDSAARSTASLARRVTIHQSPSPSPSSTGSNASNCSFNGLTVADAEGQFDDVEEVISLLRHLLSKEYVDFSETTSSANLFDADPAGVVFSGLSTILPLVTSDLLLVPSLCQSFFELVGHMAADFSDRFCRLPDNLWEPLVSALDFGLRHNDTLLARESLRGIEGLATWRYERRRRRNTVLGNRQQQQHDGDDGEGRMAQLHLKWLRDLLQLLVFEEYVWDRLDACADTILALSCAEMDQFQSLIAGLIESQPADRRERLGATFQQLVTLNDMQFEITTTSRRTFRKNMKHFLTQTRTFMRFK